jgi:hypothetical protein
MGLCPSLRGNVTVSLLFGGQELSRESSFSGDDRRAIDPRAGRRTGSDGLAAPRQEFLTILGSTIDLEVRHRYRDAGSIDFSKMTGAHEGFDGMLRRARSRMVGPGLGCLPGPVVPVPSIGRAVTSAARLRTTIVS